MTLASFSHLDLYGAGSFARQISELLTINGFQIRNIYDRLAGRSANEYFRQTYGLDVLSASVISAGSSDIPVLNCCFNSGVSCKNIMSTLQKAGRFALPPAIYYPEISANAKSWNYWLDDLGLLKDAAIEIKQVRSWLKDDKSREIWDGLCQFRLGDWMSEPTIDHSKQYFPSDLSFPYGEGLRMVDLGACVGDALFNAINQGISITGYMGFEPDLYNLQQLKVGVARCMDPDDAILLPLAAAETTSKAIFAADGNTSSRILCLENQNQCGSRAEIVSTDLDSVIAKSFSPNLIKMDIEGYELRALAGSLSTINTFKPVIAMAAYHNSIDLISFMKYVTSLSVFDGYSWYLRQHGWNALETVIYAIHES